MPVPGLASQGLQPPKLAVEIDTYPNPGAGSVCNDIDSRRDDEPVANHAALVYWGEETVGSFDAIPQGGISASDPQHLSSVILRTGALPRGPSASGSNAIPFFTVTDLRR